MRKIWLFIFLMQVLCLSARNNPNSRYVMRPRADDLLYFILPFDVPCTENGKAASLDLTYVTSATHFQVNMSVWTPVPLSIDSVVFLAETPFKADSLTVYFLEKDKKQWWSRMGYHIPAEVLEALYAADEPYRIAVYAGNTVLQYRCPSKKWASERRWMSELLQLMAYNRKRP